jgi:outer membrane protein OmpA-like peptidoglycan-associated protein
MKKLKIIVLFIFIANQVFAQPDVNHGVIEVGADYPCFAEFKSDSVVKIFELKTSTEQLTLPAGKYNLSLNGKSTGPFYFIAPVDIPANTIVRSGIIPQARFRFEAELTVLLQDTDGTPYPYEKVELFKPTGELIKSGNSDFAGKFSVIIPKNEFPLSLKCSFFDTTLASAKQMVLDPISSRFKRIWKIESPRSFSLSKVNFEGKSAKLMAPYDELDKVAAFIAKKKYKFEIGSYTDNTGDSETNLKLSIMRAKSVKDYLMSKGVEPWQLKTQGYGNSQVNSTADGKTNSRKISITAIL